MINATKPHVVYPPPTGLEKLIKWLTEDANEHPWVWMVYWICIALAAALLGMLVEFSL